MIPADEPGVARRQAEDHHHEQGRAGQELLLQLPAEGVEESAAQGEDQRQELVDGQKHEVVVVGLVAPPHQLLAQPVVHRTPDAGPEAGHIGEEAGEEQHVHNVEEPRGGEPHAPLPEQPDVGAADDEHQHGDPHERAFRHVALIFEEGEPLDARGELGRHERPEDDEHGSCRRQLRERPAPASALQQRPERDNSPREGQDDGVCHERLPGAQLPRGADLVHEVARHQDVQIDEQDGDGDEGDLLRGEAERQQRRDRDQPAVAALRQVAPDRHHERQGEEGDVDVVAGEAAEVEERGRDGEEPGGDERAGRAQLSPQQEREPDQRDAEQRRQQPRTVVAGAEDEESPRRAEVLERAVIDRVVSVLDALGDIVGELDVDTLVVVDGAQVQVPQPEPRRERHQRHDQP